MRRYGGFIERHAGPARYNLLRGRLAEAAGDPSSGVDLSNVRRSRWPAELWSDERSALLVEILPEAPADRLGIFIPAATGGGAVELRWDGEHLGTFAIGAADRIEVDLAVTPTLHLLEIAPITGARPRAGTVRLLRRAEGG